MSRKNFRGVLKFDLQKCVMHFFRSDGNFFSGTIFLSETKLLFQNHFISHQIQVNSTSSFFLWKNFKNSSLKKGNMLFHSTYSVRKIQYSHFFVKIHATFKLQPAFEDSKFWPKEFIYWSRFSVCKNFNQSFVKKWQQFDNFVDS